jgi:hypothetical protein
VPVEGVLVLGRWDQADLAVQASVVVDIGRCGQAPPEARQERALPELHH